MNDFCGRFHLVKDMNGDLAFSITDVWLIVKFLWLLPAKMLVGVAHESDGLATFFEISCSTGESWGGGMFSFFAWLIVFAIIGTMLESR